MLKGTRKPTYIPVKKVSHSKHEESRHTHDDVSCVDRDEKCDACCVGLSEAYGIYFEAAGSLFEAKLLLLNTNGELVNRYTEFLRVVDYFASNVRTTLLYIQDNCKEQCCNNIALSTARVSIGYLEMVLTIFLDPRSIGIQEILDIVLPLIEKYRTTIKQLINTLCNDTKYEPLPASL